MDISLYERSDFLKIIWCYLFCMLCWWLLSGFRLLLLICNVKVKPIINKLREAKSPKVEWLRLLWCKFFVDYYNEIQYRTRWKRTLTCISLARHFMQYIKHEMQCFITRWNTEKRVENTSRSRVFLTNFEVFHMVMKCCVTCLILLLKQIDFWRRY